MYICVIIEQLTRTGLFCNFGIGDASIHVIKSYGDVAPPGSSLSSTTNESGDQLAHSAIRKDASAMMV